MTSWMISDTATSGGSAQLSAEDLLSPFSRAPASSPASERRHRRSSAALVLHGLSIHFYSVDFVSAVASRRVDRRCSH